MTINRNQSNPLTHLTVTVTEILVTETFSLCHRGQLLGP